MADCDLGEHLLLGQVVASVVDILRIALANGIERFAVVQRWSYWVTGDTWGCRAFGAGRWPRHRQHGVLA